MPGTQGEIRVPLSNTGFVRWEVRNDIATPTPNENALVRIGNQWTATPGSAHAFVIIDMFTTDNNGVQTPIDGDVYIRGVDTRPPVWTARLNPGTLYDEESSGFVTFASADVGSGPRQISWELVDGMIPPGMDFAWGSNNILTLLSNPGGPTLDGDFTFSLGINLPGTMRVTSPSPFTMVINPVPGVMVGDVDGNGQRNLADLVMLAKFLRNDPTVPSLPNPDAANITSAKGGPPNLDDLDILARYFTRPDAPLAPETSTSP